jgi:putative CocE/NonD family hydrolase
VVAAHQLLASRVRERLLRLSPPHTRDVQVERDLPIPMPDGVVLLADRYIGSRNATVADPSADGGHEHPPTVLIRTPYGRTGTWSLLYAPALAERGFQVIIQSVRGTSGSGGTFVPRVHERDDGLATVRWIREQPWFGGRLAGAGMSYLGYALWAIADEADLDAVCLQATMPSLAEPMYDGGSFALGIALPWTAIVSRAQPIFSRLRNRFLDKDLQAGMNRLPLTDSDRVALGRPVGFYQDWLSHGPDDEYWTAQSHTHRVTALKSPVSMRTGWYDIYLPWMLRDYAALCAAGNPPRLTIGPWGHTSPGMLRGIPRETVDFLAEHLLAAPPRAGGRVRYHVTGADEWRDADIWPPPGGRDHVWSLGPAGALMPVGDAEEWAAAGSVPGAGNGAGNGATVAPLGSASVFRYDPTDPTPAVGGPTMLTDETSVDNRNLEQRSDVLVFTSLPLLADVDVIGTPRARVTVSSDNRYHDLFVRICDVHPDGSSMNLGGRLIRLDDIDPDPDGVREVDLELWPAAHRFEAGHRIRVQVSGGAHPRYARNPGTGEPFATATRMVASTIAVHHDERLISTITLPVGTGT